MKTQSKKPTVFAVAIADAARDVVSHRKMLANVKLNRATITKISKLILACFPSAYIWAHGQPYGTGVTIGTSLQDVPGLKDPKLMDLLGCLTEMSTEQRSSDYVSETVANRDFRFKLADNVTVSVGVYIAEGNPTCKSVKIGEETRIVAKYEILCE